MSDADRDPHLQRWVQARICGRIYPHRTGIHLSIQHTLRITDGHEHELFVLDQRLTTLWNLSQGQARSELQRLKRAWFSLLWPHQTGRNKRNWVGAFRIDNAEAHDLTEWSLRLHHDLTRFVEAP